MKIIHKKQQLYRIKETESKVARKRQKQTNHRHYVSRTILDESRSNTTI